MSCTQRSKTFRSGVMCPCFLFVLSSVVLFSSIDADFPTVLDPHNSTNTSDDSDNVLPKLKIEKLNEVDSDISEHVTLSSAAMWRNFSGRPGAASKRKFAVNLPQKGGSSSNNYYMDRSSYTPSFSNGIWFSKNEDVVSFLNQVHSDIMIWRCVHKVVITLRSKNTVFTEGEFKGLPLPPQNAEIQCQVLGRVAGISWKKGDHKLEKGEKYSWTVVPHKRDDEYFASWLDYTLTVKNLTLADKGEYVLHVSGSSGRSVEQRIKLQLTESENEKVRDVRKVNLQPNSDDSFARRQLRNLPKTSISTVKDRKDESVVMVRSDEADSSKKKRSKMQKRRLKAKRKERIEKRKLEYLEKQKYKTGNADNAETHPIFSPRDFLRPEASSVERLEERKAREKYGAKVDSLGVPLFDSASFSNIWSDSESAETSKRTSSIVADNKEDNEEGNLFLRRPRLPTRGKTDVNSRTSLLPPINLRERTSIIGKESGSVSRILADLKREGPKERVRQNNWKGDVAVESENKKRKRRRKLSLKAKELGINWKHLSRREKRKFRRQWRRQKEKSNLEFKKQDNVDLSTSTTSWTSEPLTVSENSFFSVNSNIREVAMEHVSIDSKDNDNRSEKEMKEDRRKERKELLMKMSPEERIRWKFERKAKQKRKEEVSETIPFILANEGFTRRSSGWSRKVSVGRKEKKRMTPPSSVDGRKRRRNRKRKDKRRKKDSSKGQINADGYSQRSFFSWSSH